MWQQSASAAVLSVCIHVHCRCNVFRCVHDFDDLSAQASCLRTFKGGFSLLLITIIIIIIIISIINLLLKLCETMKDHIQVVTVDVQEMFVLRM